MNAGACFALYTLRRLNVMKFLDKNRPMHVIDVRISRNPQLDVLVSVYRSVRNRFLSREINTCVNNQTDN
jgi:hypothetical protein